MATYEILLVLVYLMFVADLLQARCLTDSITASKALALVDNK